MMCLLYLQSLMWEAIQTAWQSLNSTSDDFMKIGLYEDPQYLLHNVQLF